MRVYTFSEARQQLASLLDRARREGQARIRRRDGQEFLVKPIPAATESPFDIPGVRSGVAVSDIVSVLRESRRSTVRLLPAASRKSARERKRGRRRSGA